MKIAKTLLFALMTLPALMAQAQNDEVCVTAYERAEQDKVALDHDPAERTVKGVGRLYFHAAPDERCRLKNVFVIARDRLEIYAQYGDFTEVIYWNPVSGTGTAGWVLSARLAEETSVVGMR